MDSFESVSVSKTEIPVLISSTDFASCLVTLPTYLLPKYQFLFLVPRSPDSKAWFLFFSLNFY